MNRYRIYGLVIETEVEFVQFGKASDNEGNLENTVFIREEKCATDVMDIIQRENAIKEQYFVEPKVSCFFNKGGYYLIRDGREIVFETKEGYDAKAVSPWLLGYCMAILLYERHTIAIHCSAVAGDKGAFLISGEMGAGKSSLTRKMLERGYSIMADDVAAVRVEKFEGEEQESAVVYPAFPYQKLCRNEVESRNLDQSELIYIDEAKDKFLVPVRDKFIPDPRKLQFLIYLVVAKTEDVVVQKMSGLNQLMSIRQNVFLHRFKGSWENGREYGELCLNIASHCPVYMIARPVEGNSQDKIADIVEKIIRGEEV